MNQNDLENQVNVKKKFSSLKEENEDNLIEKSKITTKINNKENDFNNDSIKYQMNYDYLLNYISERKDKKIDDQNEFFCNLLLMPTEIKLTKKLSTFYTLSDIYIKTNQKELILRLNHKLEKYIKNCNNFSLKSHMALLNKSAHILWEEYQNFFYAMDYIEKSCSLLNQDIKGEINDFERTQVSSDASLISQSIINYIDEKKKLFKEEGLIDKAKKLSELINKIINEQNNKDIDENDENKKYLYVISKDWLIKLLSFINSFMTITEQQNKNKLIEDIFNTDYVHQNYEKDNDSIKNHNLFPGPINNYKITSLKDSWKDNENLDENDYIKKKSEYLLINYDDWNYIDNIFGHTNILRRKKDNLDLISFKYILFDERINTKNKNINLLKEKYIQVNKNIKLKALKEKILRCADNELKPNQKEKQICFFILDRNNNDILIEITFAYILAIKMFESIYIKKIEFQDEDNLEDFFSVFNKEKHILIVEITKKNGFNFIVEMSKNNYKCTNCYKKLENESEIYKCEICHYSIFCSKSCANRASIHISLDKKLRQIMETKFMLKDMISDKYNYLLSSGRKGRVMITTNEGDEQSFFPSSLHCLSHTLGLTKYFITNSYKKDLKGGKEDDFPQFYYNLINHLWEADVRGINIKIPGFLKLIGLEYDKNIDANDFIFTILQKLNNNLNRSSETTKGKNEEQKVDESDEDASKRFMEFDNKKSNSIITDLIRGQCKEKRKCLTCGNEYNTFPNFIQLKVPISNEKLNIQIKLLTTDLKVHYINIKINDKTEMKDILLKSTQSLNKQNYIKFLLNNQLGEGIFNYNITDVPKSILYDNMKFMEVNKEFKAIFFYSTSYNNYLKDKNDKNNNNEKIFDHHKYKEYAENKNNCELVVIEKDIDSRKPTYITIWVYPIADIEKETIFYGTKKIQKILSYPVVLAINRNYSLNDLHQLIFKKFKKALISNFQSQQNSIDIYFPHFDASWELLKMKDGKCPICQKKYTNSISCCNLFQFMDKTSTIKELLEKQGERPIILYAKSDLYDERSYIYDGMELYFGKNNEIETKEIVSIYDSFEQLNNSKTIDESGKWFCKICKENRQCAVQKILYKLPIYLIVVLNRNINQIKNDKLVEYKEVIDLKDYILGPDKDKSKYDLYAVLLHKKSLNNNYYYNYCKSFGMWICFDQDGLQGIDSPINKDAYILFYKRRNID